MRRDFPEARADYEAFLQVEPAGVRAEELSTRLRYVNLQSLRTLARRIRDGQDVSPTAERFDVGIFPLYNASDILLMDQVGFALTGVVNNALVLLDHFVDIPLRIVLILDLRSLLDEVLPSEVYAGESRIPPGDLARALGARHVVTGSVSEILGSLSAVVEIGAFSGDSVITAPAIQSSYSPSGLERLQREIVFLIADELETLLEFQYVPDKASFGDSLETYLLRQVDTFLEYGFATEQVLLGDLEEAETLLAESTGKAAATDLAVIPSILGADSPPADNLIALTEPPAVEVAQPIAGQDSTEIAAPAGEIESLPTPARAARHLGATTLQVAAFQTQLGRRSLVHFGVDTWVTGSNAFDAAHGLVRDPRDGKPATLDPTRLPSDRTIRVVVPVPPPTNASEPG
jgi:hypothetical protein